ncbi:MAG TPA: ABC transporter permease [Candidatus Acidoferrum sp.]|nr:ABC transporter permease [Candidatus Acidoferrum sp.]
MFWRKRKASDFRAEIEMHLQNEVERLREQGLSEADARAAARREFGNVTHAQESFYERSHWMWLDHLKQDFGFGLRMLRKSPGFATIVVLTLALGIGANTAIFSYVNAWLIKPLPYPQADRLMVFLSHDKKKGWTNNEVTSAADFLDFQRANSSFQQTAAWTGWNFNLIGDGGPPAFVEGGKVSWSYFETLGAKPILGRTFTEKDDVPGGGHVVVLGQGLWQGRFAGDPGIVGRTIRVDDEQRVVIGVMPSTFQFPLMGIANMWTPLALTEKQRADRNNSWFSAFGKLKPGVSEAKAAAESEAIFVRLEKEFPTTNVNVTQLVRPMAKQIGEEEGTTQVMICFWIVGLILLIACANVANLMLVRATRRAKEFAVRRALGATRARLVRQVLCESLLMFFLGGVAGALFGAWGMKWIESQIPAHIRGYLVNYGKVDLDFTTLAFTLGIALLCGLVFGLAPAFEGSRTDLNSPLKESSGRASDTKRGARLRKTFVGAEIALAVVVLISTTLLVKSFVNSVRTSPGFSPQNLMVAQMQLPKTRYPQESTLRNFSDQVLQHIRALPQVISAGAASSVPFGGFGETVAIAAVGKPKPKPEERLGARFTAASNDYFSAMKIELIKGRTFTSEDAPGGSPSGIINQTLARQLWPDEDPIGHQLEYGDHGAVCTIVGIVGDVKMYNLRSRPERQMYVSLSQFPSSSLGFVARVAGGATEMGKEIRDQIWTVDKDQPVSTVEPLDTLITVSDAGNRVLTKLMVFFGLLATFLGSIGIYGVIAHHVSERTHEIGIRVALGASPLQVLRMVLMQGMSLTLTGLGIGLLAGLAAGKSLASLLYNVTPGDPATFFCVALVFALVAAAAAYLPAKRAMRVDPVVALRHE